MIVIADCMISQYINAICDMYIYNYYSELKHLINYNEVNTTDAVSSGERIRQ